MPAKEAIFHFKKFDVRHDRSTMKVGTDAVLLGAWVEVTNSNFILDVGTGSGVIALMLAQRTTWSARIDALEPDHDSFHQALANFEYSPWQKKLRAFQGRAQDFNGGPYDLIVSNPPYFAGGLLPPSNGRRASRHATTLSYPDLIRSAQRLLKPTGRLALISPALNADILRADAERAGMNCSRSLAVFSRIGKPQERSLLEFRFGAQELIEESLVIHSRGQEWSADYVQLTKDFYLAL